jgi:hypothetical protein
MKRILMLIALAILPILLATLAAAQGAATGDLHITVKDEKGALVTGATVTARDPAKGLERSQNQNLEGEYSLLALPPGVYTVTVEAPGFGKANAPGQAVTVGQMKELTVTLRVSGGQTVTEVSSEAELVETQRTSSTNTIEQRRIDNLPINGRNYINFALTDSRLARDTAPSIGAAPTSGLNMSGQRARANLVNVDGADAVDNSTNGIRSTVSQEAVQEFQIITNGYAAEYGRAGGGVVNIITRSGTNAYHGSLYGYLRNRNFQAVNPFSTVSNPAYTRTQAGLAFGGPIKKDKTFFYFSYEGTWRQETGFSSIGANHFGLVPFDGSAYIGAPAGVFPIQATPDQVAFLTSPSTLQAIGASPAFAQAVGQYVGLVGRSSGMALNGAWPGIPQVGGGVSAFPTSCITPPCAPVPASFVPLSSLIGNFPVSEKTGLYSLRLDHNFSVNNRLSLRGGVSPSQQTGIQVQAQGPQNFGQNAFSRTSRQDYHDWNITAQDTWTLGSNKINEALFQYSRRGLLYSFSKSAGGSNVAVNIPGFAFFGREPFSFVQRTEERYQFTDRFSWALGAHNVKFGVDVNHLPLKADFTVNFGGIYNFGTRSLFPSPFPAFSPIQTYGAGIPSNFIQGVGNPHDEFSNNMFGFFLQDSWRIKSNLTLNYGVRYDVELTPTFKAINALSQSAQDALGIAQGIPRDYNNVAPRIGLAWDPRKDGKTVVRASFGLFYDHPLLALAFDSDVADGAQAPQLVLFPGAPGPCTPTLSNLNASNAFQGLLSCLPAAFNYLPNEQRFNPAPNAPSIFVGQAYLQAGVPVALQPFGFPTAKNFVYASSQQANFTVERDLGHDMSFSLEYNFNGGRHLNRPIGANAVKPQFLVANWQAALSDPTSNSALGPLAVGTGAAPCGVNPSGQPWVSAALVSFFRPSGLNPSLANAFIAGGAGACVWTPDPDNPGLAQQILAAKGLNASCDPTTLSGCIPFSDMPANFSNGSSVYHALTANLRKRFGQHYEFLGSYTWAHTIDDSTDLQSPLSPQDNYNPSAERSNSTFDQRHRFVFSAVYESGHLSGSGFWSKFFSDWKVAPIIEASAGRPFNIITGDDRNFDFGTTTDRPLIVPANSAPNGCGDRAAASRFSPTGFLQPACFLDGTLIGNLGRNAGKRPATVFTDLRIARTIRFGERFRLEAAADAFNLINKFNTADVNPLWDSGQKTTSASDPRQFQFALKLIW